LGQIVFLCDCETWLREINAPNAMASLGEIVGEKAGAAADIEDVD
jgi:hypothetical protein